MRFLDPSDLERRVSHEEALEIARARHGKPLLPSRLAACPRWGARDQVDPPMFERVCYKSFPEICREWDV